MHTKGKPLTVSMPCASGSFPAESRLIWEVEKNVSAHPAHTELARPLWRAVVQTNIYLFVCAAHSNYEMLNSVFFEAGACCS